MATRQQVQEFLTAFKDLVGQGKRSYRKRDVEDGLDDLGISLERLWDVVQAVSVADYVLGPENEANIRNPPGVIYFFAPRFDHLLMYVKLKLVEYPEEKVAFVYSLKRNTGNPPPRRPFAR